MPTPCLRDGPRRPWVHLLGRRTELARQSIAPVHAKETSGQRMARGIIRTGTFAVQRRAPRDHNQRDVACGAGQRPVARTSFLYNGSHVGGIANITNRFWEKTHPQGRGSHGAAVTSNEIVINPDSAFRSA